MENLSNNKMQFDFRFYQTLMSIVQWSKIVGILGIADGIISLMKAIVIDKSAIAVAVIQLILYGVLYGYLYWGGQQLGKGLNNQDPSLVGEGFSGFKVYMQIQTVILMLAALVIVLAFLFITILTIVKA
ncbi:MAG: hypothetical protein MH132_06250 [Hydrotalea sp.]|nr:hypothetical protein [Hydrotalea sp.]